MEDSQILAKVFKVLMHPARLDILEILREGEPCVCHMEANLGYRQAYISQHRIVLREAGLVDDRRDGWNIFYHVTEPGVFQLIDTARQLMGLTIKPTELGTQPVACPCPKCNSEKNSEKAIREITHG
jgi:DNA-binding transcriptional ArsR family regulator